MANSWQRPAMIALGQRTQRQADGRDAPIKVEFAEVLRGLQPGIKEIAAQFEVLLQLRLPPVGQRIHQFAKLCRASFRRASIFDLQSLAVIRHDCEEICPGPDVLAGSEEAVARKRAELKKAFRLARPSDPDDEGAFDQVVDREMDRLLQELQGRPRPGG